MIFFSVKLLVNCGEILIFASETIKSEDMKSRFLGQKSPLLVPAACLMMGILVGQYMVLPVPMWVLLVLMVVLALLLWRWALAQSVAIAACFLLLGWLLVDRRW